MPSARPLASGAYRSAGGLEAGAERSPRFHLTPRLFRVRSATNLFPWLRDKITRRKMRTKTITSLVLAEVAIAGLSAQAQDAAPRRFRNPPTLQAVQPSRPQGFAPLAFNTPSPT